MSALGTLGRIRGQEGERRTISSPVEFREECDHAYSYREEIYKKRRRETPHHFYILLEKKGRKLHEEHRNHPGAPEQVYRREVARPSSIAEDRIVERGEGEKASFPTKGFGDAWRGKGTLHLLGGLEIVGKKRDHLLYTGKARLGNCALALVTGSPKRGGRCPSPASERILWEKKREPTSIVKKQGGGGPIPGGFR